MKKQYLPLLLILFFLNTVSLYADMFWPALIIFYEGITKWWIIIIGLIIEIIFIKFFLKETIFKSIIIGITINVISALIGSVFTFHILGIMPMLILKPFESLLKSVFEYKYFSPVHLILFYLLIIFSNTVIEGIALRGIFKKEFKRLFLWLLIANFFSVMIFGINTIF
jgi:hypothetical protein